MCYIDSNKLKLNGYMRGSLPSSYSSPYQNQLCPGVDDPEFWVHALDSCRDHDPYTSQGRIVRAGDIRRLTQLATQAAEVDEDELMLDMIDGFEHLLGPRPDSECLSVPKRTLRRLVQTAFPDNTFDNPTDATVTDLVPIIEQTYDDTTQLIARQARRQLGA